MVHRHLINGGFTLPAIDDIISRGKRQDWIDLRDAIRADPSLLVKVTQVCQNYLSDPYAQRYHFWAHYAKQKSS